MSDRRLRIVALFMGAWLAVAGAVSGQESVGVRAGVSGDPAQFVFGGHVETAPLVDRLRFRPNVEIGLGDHRTLVALNVEFAWHFDASRHGWSPYVGAGPAANFFIFGDDRQGRDRSNVGGGLNVLAGVEHTGGLFTELKVGAIDSPSVRFTVGYVLQR